MKSELIFVGNPDQSVLNQAKNKLEEIGAEVVSCVNIENDPIMLKKALKTATQRSQLVVIVGGVGFSDSDMTVKTVSEAIGVDTACDQKVLANIAEHFATKGESLPDGAFRGAVLPVGANAFYGKKGSVGYFLTQGEQTIVMLPSDEEVFEDMMEKEVKPIIQSMEGKATSVRTFFAADVPDTLIDELMADIASEKGIALSVENKDGEFKFVLTASADSEEDARLKALAVAVKVRSALGDAIYTEEEKGIEQVVVDLLKEQGKTVATAESCTAGLLSKRLTDVNGSSDVFSMGIAAYSADIKAKVLGVPKEIIDEKGTVSREVAESMATNVRRLSGCTYGIGITGVAGESYEDKPSGLVYVSLCDGDKLWTKELKVNVDVEDARTAVRNTSATVALDMLRRTLLGIGEAVAVGSIIFDDDSKKEKPATTHFGLSFVESAVKSADETGLVDDGIILPADEIHLSYEQVDAAMFIRPETEEPEQLDFNFELDGDDTIEEAEEVVAPVVFEQTIVEEPQTEIMDEDFVLKEDAVFEEEPSVNPNKENGFVKAVKNFIPWKGDNLSKVLTKILFAAIIVSLVVSSCYVGDFMVKYFQNKSIVDDARDKYDRNDDSVNDQTGVFNRYELLLQQNSECVGWITVPNTNVDNPIYQTVNNDFYLDHNGIKEKSVYGAIFADYRDIISRAGNSKNITLYGHHMKDGSMFAQLHRYKTISFYKENPVITFDTIYGTGGQYKVFACMITNADNMDDNGYFFDFAAPSFRSDADFMSWIEQIRRRSLYNTAVDVNANDQILTLSTCTYEVKGTDLLCVVVARKVRDGESVAVNTGDVTTNSKIIYPQAWYDHFKGVKPTYADGLYTWVSGDYDREDVNAPGSIAPESVVSDITSNNTSSNASSEEPVSSQAPTSSEAPVSSTAPSQQMPTPTNPFTSSAEMQAPTPIAPLPTPIG